MRIAIIGATGMAGSAILTEAVSRGHMVTAIARDVSRVPKGPSIEAVSVDVRDAEALTRAVRGHDAIISAYRPKDGPGLIRKGFTESTHALLEAARATGARLLFVGGAASLTNEDGVLVLDTPEFPNSHKPLGTAMKEMLDGLRTVKDVNWTFLSPSAMFQEGPSTGRFRIGEEQLLVGKDGTSGISNRDYAIAMMDELEKPCHTRKRFTVGY